MSCAFETELTAYIDGELKELDARRVAEHLPHCAECLATESLLRRAVSRLAELPELEPSPALRRQVLTRVGALPKGPLDWLGRKLKVRVLVPFAGLAVACGLLLVLRHGGAPKALPPLTASARLELARNFDLVDNYAVIGLDGPEDLAVVEHLQELEKTP